MDIYRELILDHYKHPRNFGHLKRPDVSSHGENVTCGDSISIELKFATNHKLLAINDISFFGHGCAISQASASLLTEYVKTKSVEDVKKLQTKDILSLLNTTLTPSRIKCATLPLEVTQKAVGEIERR